MSRTGKLAHSASLASKSIGVNAGTLAEQHDFELAIRLARGVPEGEARRKP
jgi:hypothetical protein